MRIKSIEFKDYCGYDHAKFDLNRDFTCFHGSNGCGKTTVLNAITTLCSSLDFNDQQRLENSFRPNIRDGCKSFFVKGLFEHDGQEYEVILTEKGFLKNDILTKEWWRAGLTYFAKFDSESSTFCLHKDKWDEFKYAYESIMGFKIEPDFYDDIDESTGKVKGCYATGFFLDKPKGKVSLRRASAGEKKVAKSLSQVVNLPKERLPKIMLVDNLEMHVYHKRHLIMFEVIKKMFSGMQVVSTSHSTVVIDKYEPKTDLIDIESCDFKGEKA